MAISSFFSVRKNLRSWSFSISIQRPGSHISHFLGSTPKTGSFQISRIAYNSRKATFLSGTLLRIVHFPRIAWVLQKAPSVPPVRCHIRLGTAVSRAASSSPGGFYVRVVLQLLVTGPCIFSDGNREKL